MVGRQDWSRSGLLDPPRSLRDGERNPFTAWSMACVSGSLRLDMFARGANGKLYGLSGNGIATMIRLESETAAAAV